MSLYYPYFFYHSETHQTTSNKEYNDQSQPYNQGGYFTAPITAGTVASVNTAHEEQNEDLSQLNENIKDISDASYLQSLVNFKPDSLYKPVYVTGGAITQTNLDKKGTVTLENVTFKDNLRHGELLDLLQILFKSKNLLVFSNWIL